MSGSFTVPKFRLPAFVASLGRKLPQWPHTLALVAALNAALKMKLLPESELALLEDKLFRVHILDTGGEASYTYAKGLFRPVFKPQREPDLAFAANLSAYLQLLARQEDPDTLFFNRELEITGDTELGLIVKNMLDAVELPKFSEKFPIFRHLPHFPAISSADAAGLHIPAAKRKFREKQIPRSADS